MGSRIKRALAVSATAAALVGVAQLAQADAVPSLMISDTWMYRGDTAQIGGSGFAPDGSYTLTADYGTLNNAGASLPVTASASGHFTATFTMTFDIPADISTVTISVTDQQRTTLATASIAVAEPYLVGGACPGRPIGQIATEDADGNYLTGVGGIGFPDGSYTLSSDSVTFTTTTVQASQGRLSVGGRAIANLAETFPVTATLQQAPFTSWTWTWERGLAHAIGGNVENPGTLSITGNCFVPGETVAFHAQDRHTTVPVSVTAGSDGRVTAAGVIHPTSQPTMYAGVKLTGKTSGQTAQTATYAVPGTTLLAGQALVSGQRLISRKNYYMLRMGYESQPSIWRFTANGSMDEIWNTPTRSHVDEHCRLIMKSRGNLVLRSGDGRLLWSTHTGGTRTGHYLRMRSDGVAAIYTASGKLIWTTRAGRVT